MATVPGRHHAVKEIYAPADSLNDVAGCTHSHEVTGLFLWHKRFHHVNHLVHDLRWLTHRQAADGKTIAVNFCNLPHMPGTQIRVSGTLVDAKEHLLRIYRFRQAVQPVMLFLAPLQPPQRTFTTGLGVFVGRRIFHALIKSHSDVAAQVGLDAHGFLRPHKNLPSVNVGGKIDPLLLDLPQGRQGKNLKSAGVC